jgi:hypothetical protein
MPSHATYALSKAIKSARLDDSLALMMESAADAWQLSPNAFPYALDILAKGPATALRAARALCDEPPRPSRCEAGRFLLGRFGGVPLRIWLRTDGMRCADLSPASCGEGVLCVDPYLNLKLMSDSPDSILIAECRAALAECLFVDEMPDEQLRMFIDHVRVC